MRLIDTRTYCNPISLPDCPRGADFPHVMDFTRLPEQDYRSVSDPSVLYHDGVWYLYPSYGLAWVSRDFVHWEHVPVDPPCVGYSPAIAVRDGKFYLTGHSHPLYVSDSPLGPFTLLGDFIRPDGSRFCPVDPALFCDDDGELYLYMFDALPADNEEGFIARTLGARLDPENPRRLLHEPVELNRFCPEHEWERFGERNQDTELGWIEGQWLFKHGGRYYLLYSGSGTQFGSYAMGTYMSETGPLEGFRYQESSPLTESRMGLVKGAGHGCVAEGPGGSLWAFYTVTIAYAHVYERRIGMDPVYAAPDGTLRCRVTDTPQFGPGTPQALAGEPDTGLLPLTLRQMMCCRASSHAPGRDPLYALDESLLTWWQPADGDGSPSLLVDLQAVYEAEALRIIWRDVGLDYGAGRIPAPYRFTVEGARTEDGAYGPLCDERDNTLEENIVYRTFEPARVRYVRLTVTGWAAGLTPGVISFCVFGKRAAR